MKITVRCETVLSRPSGSGSIDKKILNEWLNELPENCVIEHPTAHTSDFMGVWYEERGSEEIED